jgi:hypothetical protein
MDVLYASAVGSLMSTKIRPCPDTIYVPGLFWQKTSPDIDHWNGVKNIGLMLKEKNRYSQVVVGTNVIFWRDV